MKNLNKTDISKLWLQMCFEDNLKAFELLFRSFNPRLIKFCIYYVKHKEAAEEIVSDVFVKCWESRQNLKIIANPETYLFVAVKNLSFNYLKKYSNIHLVQIEESNEIEFVNILDPEKEMEKKELFFLLDKAIATLPQQACIIFKLIREDGMRYKEVAEILNISPRTVQTQLFRAIKKLSIILSEQQLTSKKTKYDLSKTLVVLFVFFKIFFLSL